MAIPGQTFSILDPGLAVTPAAVNTPLFLGISAIGNPYELYVFSRISDVVETLGQGPLSEALCTYLQAAGGPVFGMKLSSASGSTSGTVTKTPVSTSTGTITKTGSAFDAYEVMVQITKDGTVGVGEFRYSLDDGYTWSPELTIPTAGGYPIPDTNLTITFVPGAGPKFFEVLDLHEFDCVAPEFGTTQLAAGISAAIASSVEFAYIVLAGTFASSEAGAVIAAAMGGHAETLFGMFRFIGVLQHSGVDDTADAILAYEDFGHTRVGVAYGFCDMVTAKPIVGWGVPRRAIINVVAARAGAISISTDMGRVQTGPLVNVVAIEHDEFRTEIMDAKRFITLRTFQGLPGYYITNGRLMSPPGSDYRYWQHRRCMDTACDTTCKTQIPFLGQSVRVTTTGTIDDRDALPREAKVKSALAATLLDPNNAEGTPGHVSALDYKIDRLANLLATDTMKTTVAIRPLGYIKTLTTELGMSALVGA